MVELICLSDRKPKIKRQSKHSTSVHRTLTPKLHKSQDTFSSIHLWVCWWGSRCRWCPALASNSLWGFDLQRLLFVCSPPVDQKRHLVTELSSINLFTLGTGVTTPEKNSAQYRSQFRNFLLCCYRTYHKRHELRWRRFGFAHSSHHHRGLSQLQKENKTGYN